MATTGTANSLTRDTAQSSSTKMKLSVVIPANDEEGSIGETVEALSRTLGDQHIPHEILLVNDHSKDRTEDVLRALSDELPEVRWVTNRHSPGLGYAVRAGLKEYTGEAVCIVMADGSDDPADVVKYYRQLELGYECVFGSRFTRASTIRGYPLHKLLLNRLVNWSIRLLFGLRYNDITNAFKCYHRSVIDGIQPILACHFNITVELPLKAIVRGYRYAVIPINWYGRAKGVSKLKIKEMGSRYLFIVLYVFLERLLSRGDYYRSDRSADKAPITR